MAIQSIHEVAEQLIKSAHASEDQTGVLFPEPIESGELSASQKTEMLLKNAGELASELYSLAMGISKVADRGTNLREKLAQLAAPIPPEDQHVAEMISRISQLHSDAASAIAENTKHAEAKKSKGYFAMKLLAKRKKGGSHGD